MAACFAASASMIPWRTSASIPASKGVDMANTPCTPRSAACKSEGLVKSPLTTSAPALASAEAFSWVLLITRTLCPFANSAVATAPPCCPVAPVTRMSLDCVAISHLRYVHANHDVRHVRVWLNSFVRLKDGLGSEPHSESRCHNGLL